MTQNSEVFLDALCLAIYSPTAETFDLLRKMLDEYNRDNKDGALSVNDPVATLYINILDEILKSDINIMNKAERASILLKFQNHPIVKSDTSLLPQLQTVFDCETATQRRISYLQKKIVNWIIWSRGNHSLRKMFAKSQKCSMVVDQAAQEVLLHEISEHARDILKIHEANNAVDMGDTIDVIDMSKPESVKRALLSHKSKKKTNILKFGWHALNRMFGSQGGAPRGCFCAFGARTHNYKSGMLMDITRWICTLNNPNLNTNEIPCVIFISFENEIYDNLMKWFKTAYINAYHDTCDHLSDEEVIAYVTEVYSKRGFKLLVFRHMGEFFGYRELVDLCSKLKSDGYRIVGLILDYITLMKTDDDGSNPVKRIQVLAQRIGNFCKHNGIFGATGLQLDSEAEKMAAEGKNNVVKRYRVGNLGDCRGLGREFEIIIFLEIERNLQGVPYLTVALNKNRIDETVPAKDRYFAMKFSALGIMDDIDGKDRSVQDIYADSDDDDENKDTAETTELRISLF